MKSRLRALMAGIAAAALLAGCAGDATDLAAYAALEQDMRLVRPFTEIGLTVASDPALAEAAEVPLQGPETINQIRTALDEMEMIIFEGRQRAAGGQ